MFEINKISVNKNAVEYINVTSKHMYFNSVNGVVSVNKYMNTFIIQENGKAPTTLYESADMYVKDGYMVIETVKMRLRWKLAGI